MSNSFLCDKKTILSCASSSLYPVTHPCNFITSAAEKGYNIVTVLTYSITSSLSNTTQNQTLTELPFHLTYTPPDLPKYPVGTTHPPDLSTQPPDLPRWPAHPKYWPNIPTWHYNCDMAVFQLLVEWSEPVAFVFGTLNRFVQFANEKRPDYKMYLLKRKEEENPFPRLGVEWWGGLGWWQCVFRTGAIKCWSIIYTMSCHCRIT